MQQEEHRDSFNSIVDGLFAGGVPSRKMEPDRKAALFQKIMETPGKGQTEGEGKVVPMPQRPRGRARTTS